MWKLRAVAMVSSLVATAMSVALLTPQIAGAAPDVVGKKYSEAVTELESAGLTPIIKSTVGSRLNRDDCIVTNVSDQRYLRPAPGSGSSFAWGEVEVSLNCNGDLATTNSPGSSVGSPEGRRAQAKKDELQWRTDHPEWCAEMWREHQDWGRLEGCIYQ